MRITHLNSVNEIRKTFLNFFVEKGHRNVPSSSLIPSSDPSLLFTNSGMVQFKEIFMGNSEPLYPRAVTSQRCLRAGGKHNDLENVGYTARHHTFFEMLGNFSFGDYFKEEALIYAWELLTEVFELEKDRLFVTVYSDDKETFDLWKKKIGLPETKIIKIADNKGGKYLSDNFWQMADVGPCGPCTEIFYDHGSHIFGGLPGSIDENGDRFIEIWNLVFMQYQKLESGELIKLPRYSVDTGMGLERISAVMQKVNSNYETDLFKDLLQKIKNHLNFKDIDHPSLRVIADHLRASSFLILDGVLPSNEGEGYVLRRIIRRALRHGHKLGREEPFFSLIVDDLAKIMGESFPELSKESKHISKYLHDEEIKFGETLNKGIQILEDVLKQSNSKKLDGKTIFLLYDTYGFPVDLTADICRERKIQFDKQGFEEQMNIQKTKARMTNKFNYSQDFDCPDPPTKFVGYESDYSEAKIISIYKDGASVETAFPGDKISLTLSESCFYAESGGQVGDKGFLESNKSTIIISDTTKNTQGVFLHHGLVKDDEIKVNQSVKAFVDVENRINIKRNHSATHLLHLALRKVLGKHVQQKGSLVNANRTRFDFSHPKILTSEQIKSVEEIVNNEILENSKTDINYMKYDKALEFGALALFGEKYGDEVRVLTIGSSKELCGGTHVKRTGDIGFFKIVNETGVSSGVRRVEAFTGKNAMYFVNSTQDILKKSSKIVNVPSTKLCEKISNLIEHNRKLTQTVQSLQDKWLKSVQKELIEEALVFNGVRLVIKNIEGVDIRALRKIVDFIKTKFSSVIIVLTTIHEGKVQIIVGVSKSITSDFKAGQIISKIAPFIGGKGGGRDDLAQAGGNNSVAVHETLKMVPSLLSEMYGERVERD